MNAKPIYMSVAFIALCAAEETKPTEALKNPEIAKIDTRLAELAEIWRDDTAIINRLTNFKRTPVQEGTQAYYKCVESSKRIQQAEAEAKNLKQKKAAIEQGKPIPDATSSSSQKSDSSTSGPFAEPIEHVATEKEIEKEAEDMGFAVVDKVVPTVAYEEAKHGPKVKDIFIGMSMTDCEKRLSTLLNVPFRTITALKDTQLWENALDNGARLPNRIPISKGIFVLVPKSNKIGMFERESIFATANPNGLVKSLIISGAYSKVLFKAQTSTILEFVKNFNAAYGVFLTPVLDSGPLAYTVVTEQGIMIRIDENFNIGIVETNKPEDVKKAFD